MSDDGNGNPDLILTHERTVQFVVRASNASPTLAAITNKTVAEGQPLVITPAASDPDGDSLTWSITNSPPGATFDPTTGVLTWTPQVFQRGTYQNISISASDGNKSVSRAFVIDVAKTNQPPTLFAMAEQIGRENVEMKFSLAATDVDGDPVTFVALSSLPPGAQLNAQTGQFLWTPNFAQAGQYTLQVGARDAAGLTTSRDVPLRIINVNRPPTLDVPTRSVLLGETLHFMLAAQDLDAGTAFTYTGTGLPLGQRLTRKPVNSLGRPPSAKSAARSSPSPSLTAR